MAWIQLWETTEDRNKLKCFKIEIKPGNSLSATEAPKHNERYRNR